MTRPGALTEKEDFSMPETLSRVFRGEAWR